MRVLCRVASSISIRLLFQALFSLINLLTVVVPSLLDTACAGRA